MAAPSALRTLPDASSLYFYPRADVLDAAKSP
jgi:hypothetical protein